MLITNKKNIFKLFAFIMVVALVFTYNIQFKTVHAVKYPCDGMAIDKVNLRKYPRTSSTLIYRLESGTIVSILGSSGNFYNIKYADYTGYAQKEYIQIGTDPTPTPEPAKYLSLSINSNGYEVVALQQALSELKFYNGEADGKFGKSTQAAVKAFQKINKLKENGVADDKLQRLLYDAKPLNKSKNTQKTKTLAPIKGLNMSYGNIGQAVSELQNKLIELGYLNGEATGLFDRKTLIAVTRFQKNNGIKKVNGVATVETQALIFSAIAIPADEKPIPDPTATPKMPDKTLKRGAKGKAVENVQKMLTGMGYYSGKIDGIYNNVIDAVTAFQKNNKLKSDGVCGEETLKLMFSQNAVFHPSKATLAPLPSPIPDKIEYPIINENARSIREGDSGQDVLYLQARLTELGYYSARMDGKYLADDRAAIMAFQKNNNLTADGIAGLTTLTKLFSDTITSSTAVATTIGPSLVSVSLRLGDSGSAVLKLQERLIELKYLNGKADGNFGESTKNAVIAFQKNNKLSKDGIAGATTLEMLYSSTSKSLATASTSAFLKKGDSSPAVKELQQLLINIGYLDGKADGIFGSATYLALMKFQARNGLKEDGIAGALTFERLKSDSLKIAKGATPTAKPAAPSIANVPTAKSVIFGDWYTSLRAVSRKYPNVTVYDYVSGLSWQLKIFSTGSHADAVPVTLEDTEKMYKAFGSQNTWTPKPVWVMFSNGAVYMATMHNVPHGTYKANGNGFDGHLCVHFPRTATQVHSIGPYAEAHQAAVEIGWKQTQQLAK